MYGADHIPPIPYTLHPRESHAIFFLLFPTFWTLGDILTFFSLSQYITYTEIMIFPSHYPSLPASVELQERERDQTSYTQQNRKVTEQYRARIGKRRNKNSEHAEAEPKEKDEGPLCFLSL